MKSFFFALCLSLLGGNAFALYPVMVKGFDNPKDIPTVWVVNIPSQNASVSFSKDHPQSGDYCLKLHYQFVSAGSFQYLGIPIKVDIKAPVHILQFYLYGDDSKCAYGVQVTDADGETHQYSPNTDQGGYIDFRGWRKVDIDLDSHHETWGGDNNGKIDYPITGVTFIIRQPREGDKLEAAEGDIYFDSLSVESEQPADVTLGSCISVLSPEYCSDIRGNTRIQISAPGFKTVTAKCWKQGKGFGEDSIVATVALDEKGRGSFVFSANSYPHGPITVRISGKNQVTSDNCYLQLFNEGGVRWDEGIPKDPPPAAKGMKLIFEDDFNGPLSIGDSSKKTYYDHKPPNGSQDFSSIPFTSFDKPNNPFKQVDSYLRIRADANKNSTGLISSLHNDGSGIIARAPCYFECRFIAPNAIGTWPAFWLLTADKTTPGGDELDIIEAYGGEGPHEPNSHDAYMITPHCWNQGKEGNAIADQAFKDLHNPCHMRKFGIPSTWYEAFHTYGCKITPTETIYYCDNIEVGRHPTLPISKTYPLYFLVDLATGGGWPVDLSRYNGRADMYVDYIRVYSGYAAK